MKTLVAFATEKEARASLDLLKAVKIDENFYSIEKGYILITGMGALQSACLLSKQISKCDKILNLGIAGSLKSQIKLSQIIPIAQVSKWMPYPEGIDNRCVSFGEKIHPTLFLGSSGHHLITSNFPIHNESIRDQLSQTYDIVDMEGYGIAYLATQFKKPCQIWKAISDLAKLNGEKLIEEKIDELSYLLAKFLLGKFSSE